MDLILLKKMFTPRLRMWFALAHRKPDRPPLDLGSTPNTGISKLAYLKLVQYLGIQLKCEPRILHVPFQLVEVEEEVLEVLHIDTRPVYANPPARSQARFLEGGAYKDEWGVIYRPVKYQGQVLYYDMVESPLSNARTLRDVEGHSWPDPCDPTPFAGLGEKAKKLRDKTEYALVGHPGFSTSIFQAACSIRGYANFLIDLMKRKELAHAILQIITEIQIERMKRYLQEVGPYLDVVCVGDDFCHQRGPLMSLQIFREMLKPYLKRYYETIKSFTSAKLHLHSCGAVHHILDELIDIGVDIINPVQVSAEGMEPSWLKKRFGEKIVFWGGIDTQKILPFGSVEDVRREVRRITQILGENGGYVLSAVHNIQADVPPENIVAMFDEAYKLGQS
jgi:uroporphyrinogen decarboxylase